MKKLAALLCVLFLYVPLFSINFERPEQFIEFDISCLGSRGTERNTTLYSVEYGVNGKKYDGILGIQFCPDVFDTTFALDFYPSVSTWKLYSSTISLGGGLMYHFQNFFDVGCEHDAFAVLDYKFKTKKNFLLSVVNGIGIKAAKVYELASEVPYIWNKNVIVALKLEKLFENGIEIFAKGSSFTMYRYALFISPRYAFGAAYNFDSGLRFGGEFEIGFSDQYTTGPYVNSIMFRLSTKYTF